MPRYDVITFIVREQGYYGEPLGSSPHVTTQKDFVQVPPAFIAAVNDALASGATLVGGVSTAATPRNEPYGCPTFTFSQAVLYPA
jgi:hypothetical protein